MSKDCCNNCKEGKTCCSETSIIEAKFTDDTLAPRIKHWASKHKGTGIGYGHVLGQLAVHMKEMGWNKSYKEVARVAVELGKKKKVESVNEGTKAFLAYREMKEALNVAIYGIKKMRKFIDDAPYNPKFNMITKELYKWEIDLEKKWRRVVPQISKISKDKMLEAAPMGRASVVGLSVNKDLVIPKNQMSKAKSQYKKMMNHLMKAGKSMTQPGEIDMMVSHMESAYDEMLALWKNVKEIKKESINEISGIQLAKKVVKNKQHEKGMDLFTAQYIVQTHDAYKNNPRLRKQIEKLSVPKAIKLAQFVMGKR